MLHQLLASVTPTLILLLFVIGGYVAAALISALIRRRQRRAATSVQLNDGQSVTFEAPRRGIRDSRRTQINGLFLVGLAVWAAVLSAHGAPVLGPFAAFVFLELALATYRISTITRGAVTDKVAAARVAPLLRDTCTRAGCPVPRVVLRDDIVRAAAVRRIRKQTTLILSRAFVNAIDDEALEALLAHEVVHIAMDDLKASKRRALIAVVLGGALSFGAGALTHLDGFVGMPIWLAAFMVGFIGTTAALSPLNRPREQRADLEGARLVNNTDAMVRALEAANALSEETRLRLFGPLPWRWILSPISWRMPTHPPMAQRIAGLRSNA